jgi:hypothetical protein
MQRWRTRTAARLAGTLAAALAGAGGTGLPAGGAAADEVAAPAAAPEVDAAVMAALARMGAFLRAQGTLVVQADTTTDEVLLSGQKIQLASHVDLRVHRPDRLRADVQSDRKTRRLLYDGRTFTIFSPRTGYYAQAPAPPTLRELAAQLAQRYGVDLPLADLFYWGTDQSGAADVRTAMNVGPSSVAGALCDHYAFRQPGVDWQIWIERGAQPLPRKLVVTTTDEPAQPQHTVLMTWSLNPPLEDQLFAFVPPNGAQRIELEAMPSSSAAPRPTRQGRTTRAGKGPTP